MRKIGKKYTPEEEKAMDEKFIADMHELYTNYTDVRDNPYADEYNTEMGIALESALAHIAQSIASSMRAYANVYGGFYQDAYATAIADALYSVWKSTPYMGNDDYIAFINKVLNSAKAEFIDKAELDIDNYN